MPDLRGMAMSTIVGLGLSLAIGLVAYWRGSLSGSGVVGAVVVGTLIAGLGGWVWGILLIAFFVSSSLLSHCKAGAKAGLAEKFAKGSRRDLGQVLANGGVGALLATANLVWPGPVLLAGFVGAMAAVNADTWATELGVLGKRRPRLITTWRTVEVGTSGGVSAVGTAAGLGGAAVIGALGFVLRGLAGLGSNGGWETEAVLVPAAVVGGLAGSTVDSLLGATVQAVYYSGARRKETEKRVDSDGTPNDHLRGWPWLGNDAVNLVCSCVGAVVGGGLWLVLA